MPLRGKKLGLLVSAAPEHPGFRDVVRLAEAALDQGVRVFLYCIDDAVMGLADTQLQALKARGANLFACAYAAQRRSIPLSNLATFAGLATLSDLAASTDRFLAFT
jgi:sulfur relay (sulfurtransferase) complex TusBCD TusD component (DsrE family)